MVFLIDISNLDSHLFEMLSQTSDNLYIYMADLERDFSRWSKSSVDYFNLPGEYIDKSTLEVYRASTLPPEYEFLIQNEPAWTLKKRVAEWFRDRAKLISVSRYIYKATINKDDIVAYTNCRKEYEVVQIGSVKDIQCIESPLDPKVRYLKKEISI